MKFDFDKLAEQYTNGDEDGQIAISLDFMRSVTARPVGWFDLNRSKYRDRFSDLDLYQHGRICLALANGRTDEGQQILNWLAAKAPTRFNLWLLREMESHSGDIRPGLRRGFRALPDS